MNAAVERELKRKRVAGVERVALNALSRFTPQPKRVEGNALHLGGDVLAFSTPSKEFWTLPWGGLYARHAE